MSSCLVMYNKKMLLMCGDSATSCRHENELYRVDNDSVKIKVIGDKIVFLSGVKKVTEAIEELFSNSDNSIENLRNIMKDRYNYFKTDCDDKDFNIVAMVGIWENDSVAVYNIDSCKDFEIEKNTSDSDLYILSTGIKSKEVAEKAHYYFDELHLGRPSYKGTIMDVYKKTYDDVSFEGIGGVLTVYGIQDGKYTKVMDYNVKEKSNIRKLNDIATYAGNNTYILHNIIDNSGNEKVRIGEYAPGQYGMQVFSSTGQSLINGDSVTANEIRGIEVNVGATLNFKAPNFNWGLGAGELRFYWDNTHYTVLKTNGAGGITHNGLFYSNNVNGMFMNVEHDIYVGGTINCANPPWVTQSQLNNIYTRLAALESRPVYTPPTTP